jgi:hypothetical protein
VWLKIQNKSSQGAENEKLSTCAFAITLAITITTTASKAHAQDSPQYIYYTLRDSMHSTAYFSDAFPGDYSEATGCSVAFTNYVHGQFSNVIGVASGELFLRMGLEPSSRS